MTPTSSGPRKVLNWRVCVLLTETLQTICIYVPKKQKMETLKPIVTEKLNLIFIHKICSQLFKGTTFYNTLIGSMQHSRYRDLLIIICVTSEPCYNFIFNFLK